MEEAANFDIGLEDFDHEFGFLMDDQEKDPTDFMNKTICDHGEKFDVEEFVNKKEDKVENADEGMVHSQKFPLLDSDFEM